MIEFRIRAAKIEDLPKISTLAIQSKAHWKYTEEQMSTFRSELTMTPQMLTTRLVFVAEEDRQMVGYYSLVDLVGNEPVTLELEHLFVTPNRLRCGIGSSLYSHAKRTAREQGGRSLVIQSDPNARGFYVRLGAKLVREIPSSIPGRTIPYFVADITQD